MRLLFVPMMLLQIGVNAQDLGTRRLVLQEMAIPGMPGIQSFAWGQHEGEWLLLGGRTDGLHRRQPFAAFLAADNNTSAYVVNPVTQQVWTAPMNTLPVPVFEQLQCTNMEFEQRGNALYIIGGYGFSPTANDHITHSKLTAVDVPGAIAAIKTGASLLPHFRQIDDARMAVTGGHLGLLDNEFHLVGGQRFIGRYNPQGPDFGPGFIQEYTNSIRRFAIDDDGVDLTITDYMETTDTVNLHRRDYNLAAQVFPGGTFGFTAFTGVFQYVDDIPWLNTVDITSQGYMVVPGFEQLLNQYHTALLAAWSAAEERMSTVFFGGISRYYFDEQGQLWDDPNVPFVNTISRVEREANGNMSESAIGTMPALLGSGAEFIIGQDVPQIFAGIIDLDALTGDTVMVGHIVGGIESSAANIFFINTGTESHASARLFRVLLVNDVSTDVPANAEALEVLQLSQKDGMLYIDVAPPVAGEVEIDLLDSNGRLVRRILDARMVPGAQRLHADVRDLSKGTYLVQFTQGVTRRSVRFVR